MKPTTLLSTYACGSGERIAHARLRAEVNDTRKLFALRTMPPSPSRSATSSLTKRKRYCPRAAESGLLQRDVVVLVEIVEPDNLIAAIEQRARLCGSR